MCGILWGVVMWCLSLFVWAAWRQHVPCMHARTPLHRHMWRPRQANVCYIADASSLTPCQGTAALTCDEAKRCLRHSFKHSMSAVHGPSLQGGGAPAFLGFTSACHIRGRVDILGRALQPFQQHSSSTRQ
jgi:hypothetical protein